VEPCCEPRAGSAAEVCPSCGRAGLAVGRITLEALLTSTALARLDPGEHRFCPSPGCDVVYFGSGEPFRRADVRAPVFQKRRPGTRTVCYCFEIGEERIVREAATTGRSPSCERIRQLVKAGRCACEVRNPRGACCLGDVMELMRSARAGTERGLLAQSIPGGGV